MIKAIFFDLDNTLIEFIRAERNALEFVANAMAGKARRTDGKRMGARLFSLYMDFFGNEEKIFKIFGKEEALDEEIIREGKREFARNKEKFYCTYPNVEKVLRKLKKNYVLGIITDAPKESALMRMKLLGIDQYFDFIVSFDETGEAKPSKKAFDEALRKACCKAEEAVMVGDSLPRDIKGARDAGICSVLARYGEDEIWKWEEVECKPDFEIHDFRELLSIVEALEKKNK